MRGTTAAGIAETLQVARRRTRRHDIVLAVLDTLLSALIIGPAVVAYWRGTWMLIELYVFPDHLELSSWTSLILGLVGHFVFTLVQDPFARWFNPETHRLTYYLVSRLYTAVFGVICVNAWRGAWSMLDLYTGKEVGAVCATTLVGVAALAAMRGLRNLSAPPFAVVTDDDVDYFAVLTMFRLSKSHDATLYFLDVLYSVLVVGNLVVFVWRGAWTLVDIFLYPSDPGLSALVSLVMGYAVVVLAFSLQPLVKRTCASLGGFCRIVVADAYMLFSFVGTISVWRGVWNLLNVYFLPDSPFLSNWLTHGLCLALLMLLNCSNSILVRGVYIDAEGEGGECVVFPCSYLRLFVQAKRELKLQRNGLHPTSKRKYEVGETKSPLVQEQQQQANNTGNHVHLQLLPVAGNVATPADDTAE